MASTDNLVKVSQLQTVLTRVNTELGLTVRSMTVSGNTVTTVQYSFADMAKVIKAISAGDNSINVNGYAINFKISAVTGNLLELKSDGLYVGSDDTKADKVTGATAGEIFSCPFF